MEDKVGKEIEDINFINNFRRIKNEKRLLALVINDLHSSQSLLWNPTFQHTLWLLIHDHQLLPTVV